MVTERSVGNLSVTVLQFAHAQRSAEQLAGVFPTVGRETLEGIVTGHGDGYPWSFNGVIVDSGEAVFLVDRGFGFRSTGTGTPTAELLAESGYDAEAITSIILTHGHGDHWTGQPSSPAAAAFAAYDGQIRLIDSGELIYEGEGGSIRAIPAPGHTPGHIGLDLRSGNESLRLLADTVHTLFQLDDLTLSPSFDSDGKQAACTRQALLTEAAENCRLIGLFHYPVPGIGRLTRTDTNRLVWTPAE